MNRAFHRPFSGTLSAACVSAVVVAVAACGPAATGGSAASTPPELASAAPLPPDSASAVGSVPSAVGGAPSGAGGGQNALTTECDAAQLTIATRGGEAGSGHESILLVFTNKGSTPCFVQGYPGVALELGSGRVLNAQRTMKGYLGGDEKDSAPPYVTVAPAQSASAVLEWSDVPTGTGSANASSCPGISPSGLLVTPPDSTTSTTVSAPSQVCQSFEVHPLIPGVANALQP